MLILVCVGVGVCMCIGVCFSTVCVLVLYIRLYGCGIHIVCAISYSSFALYTMPHTIYILC